MGILLVLIVGFFAFEAVGYGVHRFLHHHWAGRLNRAHLNHHQQQYPPERFLSDRYRSAGADSTLYPFAVGGLALAVVLFSCLPWAYALALTLELAAVGAANNYVHDATHVRGHWLARFRFFRRWRNLHRVHHADMTRNYGIVTFFTDRALRTHQEPQAKHLMQAAFDATPAELGRAARDAAEKR